MGWFTRLLLRLAGWRPCLCRDGKGNRYEAWIRRDAYFHVYHEKTQDKVIRW